MTTRAPTVPPGRIAVAFAFFGLLAVLTGTAAFVAADATSEIDAAVVTKSELLADLRARALPAARKGGPAVPPELAFLAGETEAVAANRLQEAVTNGVEAAGGTPASIGITDIVDGIGGSRKIGVEIAFTADIDQLQTALFTLETGVPYILVEALNLGTETGAGTVTTEANPRLRVTLRVAGYWRPPAAPAAAATPPAGSGT